MIQQIKFTQKKSDFYSELSKRVSDYFEQNNISNKANWFMFFKTFTIAGTLVFLYITLVFGPFHDNIPVMFLLWALAGLFAAFTPVNIGHDAIHGAYSHNDWVNKIMSHSFNFLGASAYMWKTMHNQAHHMHTNIDGHDEDLVSLPILRFSPAQPHIPIHRFQHIYAFLFYSLASISWVFIKDYRKFFQGHVGSFELKHQPKDYFLLFFYKAIYYVLFIVVPFVYIEQSWWLILLGFITMHLFEGWALAFIFMLAHLVEEATFPKPDDEGKIENNWAQHQLETTADFATENSLVSFFCGGLNFQAVHHLYPKICHVHYPAISKILEQTAGEYGIVYHNKNGVLSALGSHYRLMKKLGQGMGV